MNFAIARHMTQGTVVTELCFQMPHARVDAQRMEFLRLIDVHGTLVESAKNLGISYKTACAWMDALNHAAEEPLLVGSHGGNNRGGTVLTLFGKQILERWEKMQELHRTLAEEMGDDLSAFLVRMRLRTSARNLFHGQILSISGGRIRCLVHLVCQNGFHITAQVGRRAVEEMDLTPGASVSAAFKASAIKIVHALNHCNPHTFPPTIPHGFEHNAPNHWSTTIRQLDEDPEGTELRADIDGHHSLSVLMDTSEAKSLGLCTGVLALMQVHPSHVMLVRAE